MPRVEREEFLNAGVILYCRDRNFLEASLELNRQRLSAFGGCPAVPDLENYLLGIQKICEGDPSGGPIARLDIASRFRWLTAARSTVVQTSKVHTGLCQDPGETLRRLHRELVLD